jgi:hypothetical protein
MGSLLERAGQEVLVGEGEERLHLGSGDDGLAQRGVGHEGVRGPVRVLLQQCVRRAALARLADALEGLVALADGEQVEEERPQRLIGEEVLAEDRVHLGGRHEGGEQQEDEGALRALAAPVAPARRIEVEGAVAGGEDVEIGELREAPHDRQLGQRPQERHVVDAPRAGV